MFKKVLIPMDGTPLSLEVLNQVKRLSDAQTAELMLFGVVPEKFLDENQDPVSSYEYGQMHLMLEDIKVDWKAKGYNIDHAVTFGEPSKEVVGFSKSYNPDLIAMATHGREGLARAVLGSVSEEVLRASACPVFLVNPAHGEGVKLPETAFTNILVPLDASDVSLQILNLAAEFAKFSGAALTLYHAGPFMEPEGAKRSEVYSFLEQQSKPLIEQGLKVELKVAQAEPIEGIELAIAHEKPDLVMMATHGRSGVSRNLYGSVTESVLRRCAVPMVIRKSTAG